MEQSYLRNKKKNATNATNAAAAELIQEILHLAAEAGGRLGGTNQDTDGAAQFFFTEMGEWCRSQPEGLSAFVRAAIEQARAERDTLPGSCLAPSPRSPTG